MIQINLYSCIQQFSLYQNKSLRKNTRLLTTLSSGRTLFIYHFRRTYLVQKNKLLYQKIIDKSNILTYTISEPERFREAARIKLYCAWAGNIPGL